jgi:hypothetical protein
VPFEEEDESPFAGLLKVEARQVEVPVRGRVDHSERERDIGHVARAGLLVVVRRVVGRRHCRLRSDAVDRRGARVVLKTERVHAATVDPALDGTEGR